MEDKTLPSPDINDFVPSLREAVAGLSLGSDKQLQVAVPCDETSEDPPMIPASMPNRDTIFVSEGTNANPWNVPSVRALFRGDKQPPPMAEVPDVYMRQIIHLDIHAVLLSDAYGDRTDDELLHVYSNLRRRPDGRSTSFTFDYMRQAVALLLGMYPLSQAEYEAILDRLERSCRSFRTAITSRNYVESMRMVYNLEAH